MKPSSRRGRPRQTAAPGAPGRTPWCGDRRIVVGTNRRRVSGHSSRSRGSHQLGCPIRRDDQRLAPPRERTGVLNRVKVALAALAADATLTRFPRAHRRAFIGASQDTDRSSRRTCARLPGRRSGLDSNRPHRRPLRLDAQDPGLVLAREIRLERHRHRPLPGHPPEHAEAQDGAARPQRSGA
jgi:hypothetical protein